MHHVISPDGTRIAFRQSGNGPPLLLVHGATADHTTTWRYVLDGFNDHFTVFAMDRRGRRGSGDARKYELRRESEDIAAVIEYAASAGEKVHVLGHSYGALCTFEASLISDKINRMILYEGVPLNGENRYPRGTLEKFDELLTSGDIEEILTTMLSQIVKMPPDEIDLLRSQKEAWAVRLGNARMLPRELREEVNYRFDPGRFGNMKTPVLFMAGGESPDREVENAAAIAAALPDARVAVLPGQKHIAMFTAPGIFVDEAVRFLGG